MNACTTIAEIKAIPFWSKFTEEQIRKSVKSSAEGLRKMEAIAIKKGKKVGGFTAEELNTMATRYENMLNG